MVFVDVGAVLLLTLVADARTHDLAQAVDIEALQAQAVLDLGTHILGPRLGTESAHAEFDLVLGNPQLVHGLGQVQRVRRRTGDAGDAEVTDQAGVLLGVAGRGGHDGRTDGLHAVVRAETAREEAVTVRHGEDVVARDAEGSQAARHALAPDADILAGVADDGRVARGAGRRVDADDFTLRSRLQAEGIVVPKVLLGRKRQLDNVVDRPDVGRREVHLLQLVPIERNVVVHVLHDLVEALALQLAHLLARHAFFGGIPDHILLTNGCLRSRGPA